MSELLQFQSLTILGLGFTLGLRHALDADHLIAISTIVSERKSLLHTSLLGSIWGIGHTAALLMVGVLVLAFGVTLPESIATGMELAVAAMLVGLGARVIWKILHGGHVHVHVHSHQGYLHVHPHVHMEQLHRSHAAHLRFSPFIRSLHENKRPFLIGLLHGLAGSAGLMIIILATISSTTLGVAYILTFGLGSIGGMAVMSTLLALPFLAATRVESVHLALRWTSGVSSILFGLFLGGSLLLV